MHLWPGLVDAAIHILLFLNNIAEIIPSLVKGLPHKGNKQYRSKDFLHGAAKIDQKIYLMTFANLLQNKNKNMNSLLLLAYHLMLD